MTRPYARTAVNEYLGRLDDQEDNIYGCSGLVHLRVPPLGAKDQSPNSSGRRTTLYTRIL